MHTPRPRLPAKPVLAGHDDFAPELADLFEQGGGPLAAAFVAARPGLVALPLVNVEFAHVSPMTAILSE